jgi:hypothetical protein
MKSKLLSLCVLLVCSSAFAQTTDSKQLENKPAATELKPARAAIPLSSALNLFIQAHAASRLEWQTDLTIIEDPTQLEAGKFIGKAHGLKALYSYRPVTFEQLTLAGKKDLYNDPRLLPWLEWFSGKQRLISHVGFEAKITPKVENALPQEISKTPAPTVVPQQLDSVEKKFVYTVPQEELIANRSLHLKLEAPIAQPAP